MARTKASEKVPKSMQETFERIVSITDEFARHHLNDEYAQLIRFATAALCRKRPSPLAKGQLNTWACGISHALGMVNFLFDSSQAPHMKASAVYKAFGGSQSSGLAKSKTVRDILDMVQFDPNWCLPSKMDDNPLIWLDMLLVPESDKGRTQLYWLRKHAMSNTPAALLDALEKFTLLQQWDVDQWDTAVLNPNRQKFLARLGRKYTVQALRRMGPKRRYPIVLSLLKQTLIDLTDESIDIFDVCIASRHKKAKEVLEEYQKDMAETTETHSQLL